VSIRAGAWWAVAATALLAVVGVVAGLGILSTWSGDAHPTASGPPPPGGYFRTVGPGGWRALPSGAECADRVHRSQWEPRPDNGRPNHRMPPRAAVARSLSERPRAVMKAYDPRWDSWLLARVDGHFTGTTDEILQWAACKWGLSDDLLRAIALRESNWYQGEVYPDGQCVVQQGCGDLLTPGLRGGRAYCRMLANTPAPSEVWYSTETCPRTFSIVGVMSWQAPEWGKMPGNQNGTFPFNRDSTAFAVDYLGAFLRGCTEGWAWWLQTPGFDARGDLEGCVGAWFAGTWKSADARQYVAEVEEAVEERTWLESSWAGERPPCLPAGRCPRAAP
jgi:hypothetical protein